VRGVVPADADAGLPYDAVDRPFPTGGGSGELELYVTVARCDGVEPGVYHYDAAAHGLRRLDATEQDRLELLAGAWRSAAGRIDPQVLITITSRFGRLSWKYSSIAYALTLKHVGVLYQTLYLVATAMGLAPCALGGGNADVAARAFGLDWAAESSVGEVVIGSRPAGSAGPAAGFVDVVDATRS
jgi:SagB-type dehydrogenase family enzyme